MKNCINNMIQIRDKRLKVIGLIDNSVYSGMIIPYQTMLNVYKEEKDIQFSGTFFCENELQKQKRIDEVIEQIKEKDNHADILGVTEGEELYKNALYTKIQWRIVRGMCALVAILFFMINETIVLMAKAKKERKIMGINLALGATERDIKYCLFFETLLVTLLAVFLVMITLRPLAKLASLEHIIILDSMVIVETVILAVWACEILTWIIVSRIKKENGLQDIMNCEMNPIPQLEKKQMPTKIAELNWKTETDEIKLKKCVVAPITYMEQYKEEISSAAIHVEWKKKYLKNEEKTIQKIETYLYNSHDQSFRYRIYSPEIELRNNTIKVMTSLQAINKVALLFMAVFLTGMIAIYQLRFEHREESYGISLAYGAQYKELYWEIFCEILLLNSIGTIIGIVIGYLVTYYVDFGIMISVVNVQGSWYTFLSAYGLCVVLSSFVSVITFRKLKKKKIIELLNVY